MTSQRHRLALSYAIAFACSVLIPSKPAAADDIGTLQCPSVMEVTVAKNKYSAWHIYSNKPLRLTGANIQYAQDNEEAWLDPVETKELNDDNLSVASTFALARHQAGNDLSLVCHYGVHAQLSRNIPKHMRECKLLQHRRFDELREAEFEVSCK
jgi:hypothetical protein